LDTPRVRFERGGFCTKETYDLRRVPLDKTFPRKVLSPLLRFFEKRAFRRLRTAEQANYRPVFWFHSREYEKDFAQSKPTIRSRRARGSAPHPAAFKKAGETSVFAQTSTQEDW